MIDICNNNRCPKRMTCERYVSMPNEYNQIQLFNHADCEFYLKITPIKKISGYICARCRVMLNEKKLLCDKCRDELF